MYTICHTLLFCPPAVQICFFTAPALLLRFTFFCVGIFIGNLPETLYFLLAFYRYFRVILDSVTFLRTWWQPCQCVTLSVSRQRGKQKLPHSLKMAVGQWWHPGMIKHLATLDERLTITGASPGLVKLNNKAAKNLRRSRATSRGLPKKGQ